MAASASSCSLTMFADASSCSLAMIAGASSCSLAKVVDAVSERLMAASVSQVFVTRQRLRFGYIGRPSGVPVAEAAAESPSGLEAV